MSDGPLATVALLTYNPGKRFEEVLDAVTEQVTGFDYETLVIDSGSTDGTLELVRQHGLRALVIDNKEFQHGRTRNLAMELAEGEFVVFLTHDATPASPNWLAEMIACFDIDPQVAAVFGPHLPREDCDPLMARDTLAHFRNFGDGTEPVIQGVHGSQKGMDGGGGNESVDGFFSDVNGALRRSAWSAVPYQELDYAEDQAMGRDLLQAGFKKVYCPAAAVYHSHAYGLSEYFRRMYDEFVGLKTAVGYTEGQSLWGVIRGAWSKGRADAGWSWRQRYLGILGRTRLIPFSFGRALARTLAAYLANKPMPRFVASRLSLTRGSRRPMRKLFNTSRKVLKEYGPAEFVRLTRRRVRRAFGKAPKMAPPPDEAYLRIDPDRPAPLLPPSVGEKTLTVNWVTPPFGLASGGHMTISRIVHYLEKWGHTNRIHLFHASEWMQQAKAENERIMMRRLFMPMEAEVQIGVESMKQADVMIATGWQTAYLIHGLSSARSRCYFVQDFEPYFYPVGSEYRLAENTYRFGYHHLAAGKWLADLLTKNYGATASSFDLAPDHDVYRPEGTRTRDANKVLYYCRWKTERRGYELATAAFQLLAERNPEVEVLFYGSESLPEKPNYRHRNLGILPPAQLARLYRRASCGVVVSFTNPSLVPLEMMACGLPVVDIDSETVRGYYGDDAGILRLSEPYPLRLADAVESLVNHPAAIKSRSERGLELAARFDWEKSARQVEEGLRASLR